MPKQYVLKNSIIDRQKIERILKSIKDCAEKDRIEASDLLENVKQTLSEFTVEANNLDSYVKLVSTALAAINQMGTSTEKLLKLTSLIQKFLVESEKDDPKELGSLFSRLSQQVPKK